MQGGDAYSALQRYRALFSRNKASVDDALLILSTVRRRARVINASCCVRRSNEALLRVPYA